MLPFIPSLIATESVKNGLDEEDSETEEDSNSITESDSGAVKMTEKAIKKVTAEVHFNSCFTYCH